MVLVLETLLGFALCTMPICSDQLSSFVMKSSTSKWNIANMRLTYNMMNKQWSIKILRVHYLSWTGASLSRLLFWKKWGPNEPLPLLSLKMSVEHLGSQTVSGLGAEQPEEAGMAARWAWAADSMGPGHLRYRSREVPWGGIWVFLVLEFLFMCTEIQHLAQVIHYTVEKWTILNETEYGLCSGDENK